MLLDVSLDQHSHLKYEKYVQNIIIKTERYDLYINYLINNQFLFKQIHMQVSERVHFFLLNDIICI